MPLPVGRVNYPGMVGRSLETQPDWLGGYLAVLAFTVSVLGVFLLAGLIGLRRLLRSRRPSVLDRPWLRRPVLALAGLGALCVAWGLLVEPDWVEVTRRRIPFARLGVPLKVLHLTDTHCEAWGSREERLLAVVREERPDLLVFTGDCCNDPGHGAASFRRLASSLPEALPCYGVRGNWDVWFWSGIDLFGGTRLKELDGTEVLTVRGQRVSVSGAPYDGDWAKALSKAPDDAFRIFLFHTPDLVREPELQRADLYVAGHTHGGQVRLPFYGALVTFSRYGKAYESGLFREGDCRLYVGRGLGMEGGWAPRVRFACRPEIAVLELVPEGG